MGPRGSAHRSAVPGRYNSGVDLRAAASLPAAYLLGSIPFAFLAVKWRRGVDIRTLGSGNVGATNAGRILGKPAAVAIYALDAGKGAASVLLARWLSAEADPLLEVGAGLLAIIGHVFPIWLGFRGGKGVATTTGVFAALMPIAFLIAGGAWIVVAAVTRYVSLASIALALAFPSRWRRSTARRPSASGCRSRSLGSWRRSSSSCGTCPTFGGSSPAPSPRSARGASRRRRRRRHRRRRRDPKENHEPLHGPRHRRLGTAIAHLLATKGLDVRLWGRDANYVAQMAKTRENPRALPARSSTRGSASKPTPRRRSKAPRPSSSRSPRSSSAPPWRRSPRESQRKPRSSPA